MVVYLRGMSKLKEWRERVGYSQSRLARELGVTEATVKSWDSGRFVPCARYLLPLARIFGVRVEELIEEIVRIEDERRARRGVGR